MWRMIRAFFGVPKPDTSQDAFLALLEAGPSIDIHTVYVTVPVKRTPLEISQHPADKFFRDEFNGEFEVLAANDGSTALFFPCTLESEEPDGTIVFREVRVDDEDPRDRLEPTIQIYEHLLAQGPLHPRMANYLGTTITGYRLERVKYSSVGLDLPCPYRDMNLVVLGLYQSWALQMLSVLQYLHGNNVFLNNVGCEFWLREDLSIAIPNLACAGCAEPLIKGRTCPCIEMYSPWVHDCDFNGSVRNDLFDWASWVFSLMTNKKNPIYLHLGIENGLEDTDKKSRTIFRDIECGKFDAWPQLDDKMLGPAIVKAWKGGYDSVDQAMENAKNAIRACGHELSGVYQDEIQGYDWQQELEVIIDDKWHSNLRLRLPVSEKE